MKHWQTEYTAHHSGPIEVPSLTVNLTSSRRVQYQVQRTDSETIRIIAGYEVIRYGVPMIGEWGNEGRAPSGKIVTISPAVPGARYRITAWALGYIRRSVTPAVKIVTTGEEGELY